MADERQDWLKLCNEHGVPLEQFRLAFCEVCFSQECTRSQFGKTKFDQRVKSWEERLFNNVPKMGEGDPRLVQIRAKKFITLDPGPVPEVGGSAWLDPRDLPQQDVQPEPPPPEPAPELTPPPEPEPVDEPAQDVQVSDPPEAPSGEEPTVAPQEKSPQRFINTPARTGVMVGGKTRPEPAPKRDPWAPPKAQETEGVEVVQPGARIRFDDSGV